MGSTAVKGGCIAGEQARGHPAFASKPLYGATWRPSWLTGFLLTFILREVCMTPRT